MNLHTIDCPIEQGCPEKLVSIRYFGLYTFSHGTSQTSYGQYPRWDDLPLWLYRWMLRIPHVYTGLQEHVVDQPACRN